ncbi:rod shape-determining protein MreC [Roseospirillum parvum]|uniref:Cell shape-determining protein MreC n=1 Tax=Roseospirillum parvum TaxID=83401 RepID=A0A1G7V314_9PROT|nr:rod shape-determining protein MreC [Roseospirillum parvum]SDG54156.1 rod shape-determining protein MreC [Roseospirillum parvum]
MKPPSGQITRISTLRALAQRSMFILLVLSAFGLMLLGKADTVVIERARTLVADSVAPVLEALSRPAATVADFVRNTRELVELREENARLRQENDRLLKWQSAALNLESENDRLKDLLRFRPDPGTRGITARVIADSGAAYVHSLLLNAGASDGVSKGQAVVAGGGLVGRVTEVGRRAARVLLITDINSRIPVFVGDRRLRAMLVGENRDRARLIYLNGPGQPGLGERVVTSGHAGALPPGIPVGVVTAVDEKSVVVEPYVQRHRLEYVRVIDYRLPGLGTGAP